MDKELIKFSSQADAAILSAMRKIAEQEGRQFQAVLEDAFKDYLDKKEQVKPRKHVMNAFAESMQEYDYLYKKLAE